MGFGRIIHLLKIHGIINSSGSINIKFIKKLNKHPELLRQITELTSYLQYSAPIKVRIHCLLQGIIVQPTCKICNKIVHMRISGRYGNTFPTTCSTTCTNRDPTIIQKRKITNIKKYGCQFILQNQTIREQIAQNVRDRYGVTSVLSLDSVKAKRANTISNKQPI